MTAVIDRIEPGRARAGETVRITGSGFGGYGHNIVRVDDGTGSQAVPGADTTTIDETAIDFVIPAGLARDRFITVEVTNTEDDTTATWWVYSQLTLVELETDRLPAKQPGAREATITFSGVPDEDPLIQEAKDWNRLGAKSEMAQHDLFTTVGDVAALGATGMRRIPVGANGERYYRVTGPGGEWRDTEWESAWWGGQILAAQTTEEFLVPHLDGAGNRLNSVFPQLVTRDGKLAMLCIHVTDDSNGAASRITRVRIYVEGAVAFDSNDLPLGEDPFINENGSWTLAPWLDVEEGDRVEIGVTKNNATNILNVIARAVFT